MNMVKPEQCVFALVPASASPDGVPTLIFLLPEAGWTYMANGMGHDFDLTKVGVPLRVTIGRCTDRAAGMAILQRFTEGQDVKDVTALDLSFKPPGTQ